jgi:N-acetylneuraminate lyase
MTGVHLSMIDFMELAVREIPTFRGIKYTFENLYDFGLCLFHDEKKYDVLFGRDEMLLAGLATGTKGAVGSFYNFLGAFANSLMEDYNNRDMGAAQDKQQFLRKFTRILKNNGDSIATLKSVIRFCGIDCGPARPPLQNLARQEELAFRNDLESIGFFEKILH